MIADAIERHRDTLTPGKLHFLQSVKDEEVSYEFKARQVRGNMGRERVSRALKPTHPGIRQMRAAQLLDSRRITVCREG